MAVARQSGVARREALLDAALRCFEQRGLLRTGIEDVRSRRLSLGGGIVIWGRRAA